MAKILLVEDDDDTRELVRLTLELDGHEVTEAASAEEGVSAARSARPDLILMDLSLGGKFDGLEATRRVRASVPAQVVLLLSTYDEELGMDYVADCGAAAYLSKASFGPEALEQAWARATARSQDR